MSRANSILLPGGIAHEVLPRRTRANALRPNFPRDWLSGASGWEDGPEMLHLAWELARCAPDASESEQRALILLGFIALAGLRSGSTRMPVRGAHVHELEAQILEPLGVDEDDRKALAALLDSPSDTARAVIGNPGEYKPLCFEGDWLSTQRVCALEDRLTTALAGRLEAAPLCTAKRAENALADVLDRPSASGGRPIALSGEQRAAVRLALERPLAAIAGGPGTGKTSIVASLVRALGQLGLAPEQIALAAPTGKAAARLDEALRKQIRSVLAQDSVDAALLAKVPPARTLHRLLGYSPSRDAFAHHAANPLAEEAVLVDESSMIDLVLMERLVAATRPGARLVLLGDADQLPSVDAGAVFRDLVAAATGRRRPSAVRLTQSYRMDPADPAGRNVLTVAERVRLGELPRIEDEVALADGVMRLRARADALRWEGAELLECTRGDLVHRGFLDVWYAGRHPRALEALRRRVYRFDDGQPSPDDLEALERLFAHAEHSRLLCATRASDLAGTGGVNAYLHQLELAAWRGAGERLAVEAAFVPGEPVIVERNDYERGLFNGDSGLVVRGADAARGIRWLAVFRAGESFRTFPLDGVRELLQLAHATTVHKAQGSEVDRVALILPGRDLPLLTRELLYTALTRARGAAVVVGDRELFARGVGRSLTRYSGIAEGLVREPRHPERTGSDI